MVFRSLIILRVVLVSSCVGEPETSASARPEEVLFLTLPGTASNVGFWNDGYQTTATFTVTEEEFRAIPEFQGFQFVEVSEVKGPVDYLIGGYGDADKRPVIFGSNSFSIRASGGLFFQEIAANGGGPTVVYDRVKGVGFYDWASH